MKNKRVVYILSIISTLLFLPFIAMQFSNEVNWSLVDFAVMAFLLLSTGLLSELVFRKVTSTLKKSIILIAVIFSIFLIWIELAVGIFGTPIAGS